MSDNEELVTKPFKFVTVFATPSSLGFIARTLGRPETDLLIRIHETGFDARFPNQNQTKHCWQNYVDYHKCINAKGEDFKPCHQFKLAYRSLCPSAWVERWDEQRENGIFPARLD